MHKLRKCILSLRVAQHLLARGFNLIEIDRSYRYPGKLVFIFENSEALVEELAKFERDVI